jgi:adenosylmethionine-8-amino-7-oxononanoate aminotransferase
MISEKVAEAFEANEDSFGAIGHGYTYSAHPVGCAAALACLPEMEKANVAANAAARGDELLGAALDLKQRYELVGDVRGKGLMVAVELVSDRAAKTPADKQTVAKVFETAYEAGVMIRISGNNVLLSPPLIVTGDDVAQIASALEAGLAAA